jgi:hypothetical protein
MGSNRMRLSGAKMNLPGKTEAGPNLISVWAPPRPRNKRRGCPKIRCRSSQLALLLLYNQ